MRRGPPRPTALPERASDGRRGDVPGGPVLKGRRRGEHSSLEERLLSDEYKARIEELRGEIEAEIRRRLVADRGVEALARSLRKPLPEDVDFMHATRDELAEMRKAIQPLTRKLQARLARKRRHLRRGSLDFRATVRHSLSYGGVPAEPRFRHPRPSKPEIFVIADISGSVAAFARFTLHLVHAIAEQFSQVRSFVFIDGIDEVTAIFERSETVAEAIHRINQEADVVWVDGHSDYGHALSVFWQRFGREVGPKTSILLLGDARSNYHTSEAWVVKELRHRARHVYWLNPEPRSYWGSGDSIVEQYCPVLRRRLRVPEPPPARGFRRAPRLRSDRCRPFPVPRSPPAAGSPSSAMAKPSATPRRSSPATGPAPGSPSTGGARSRRSPTGSGGQRSWQERPPSTRASCRGRSRRPRSSPPPSVTSRSSGRASCASGTWGRQTASPGPSTRPATATPEPGEDPVPADGARAGSHGWASSTGRRRPSTTSWCAHPGRLVVVAGHGGIVGASMIRFLELADHGSHMRGYADNSSITEWCWTGSRWWFVRYNDAAHLDREAWGAAQGLRIPPPGWVGVEPE